MMITVAELISKLKKVKNKKALVVVSGYEDGYDDPEVSDLTEMKVKVVNNAVDYEGRYQEVSKHEKIEDGAECYTAICIGRGDATEYQPKREPV
ncbi:MAG: hypothetical protein PHX51_08565, partial [Clostridia bacterium]|nr:hypothetical protein [Clostridia bacterium]